MSHNDGLSIDVFVNPIVQISSIENDSPDVAVTEDAEEFSHLVDGKDDALARVVHPPHGGFHRIARRDEQVLVKMVGSAKSTHWLARNQR